MREIRQSKRTGAFKANPFDFFCGTVLRGTSDNLWRRWIEFWETDLYVCQNQKESNGKSIDINASWHSFHKKQSRGSPHNALQTTDSSVLSLSQPCLAATAYQHQTPHALWCLTLSSSLLDLASFFLCFTGLANHRNQKNCHTYAAKFAVLRCKCCCAIGSSFSLMKCFSDMSRSVSHSVKATSSEICSYHASIAVLRLLLCLLVRKPSRTLGHDFNLGLSQGSSCRIGILPSSLSSNFCKRRLGWPWWSGQRWQFRKRLT